MKEASDKFSNDDLVHSLIVIMFYKMIMIMITMTTTTTVREMLLLLSLLLLLMLIELEPLVYKEQFKLDDLT